MKVSKRFQVKLRKVQKFLKSMAEPKEPSLSEIQQFAVKIIRKTVVKKDATLLIDPIKGVNYVEYKHYFIKFGMTSATITNGKFSYYIDYDYRTGEKLVLFFNRIVGMRRDELDSNYNTNTARRLSELLNEVSNIDVK